MFDSVRTTTSRTPTPSTPSMIKKCENCDYEQELRDDRKARHSWRCYDCHHSNKLGFLIIATILAIGSLGLVYSEEQPLPVEQPYDDKYCTFYALDNYVNFTCTWKWFLPDYVMAELEPLDIPTKTSEIPQHNLDLADKIRLLLEKGNVTETEIPEPRIEDVLPDEPLTAEEREIKAAVDTLAECRTGLGAWAAYQEQELIEHYADKTRWEFSIRDNLSQSNTILKILKAIEECDIMKDYANKGLIGAYELNKILADLAGVDYLGRTQEHPLSTTVTDQSDTMVETDPVTERDIAKEVEEAQRIFDEKYRDPNAPLTGENRGFQPSGINCTYLGQPAPVGIYPAEICPLSLYEAHILKNWESITYGDIKELQCKNFLYIYQHKIGTDDFPKWLYHCVPKVLLE